MEYTGSKHRYLSSCANISRSTSRNLPSNRTIQSHLGHFRNCHASVKVFFPLANTQKSRKCREHRLLAWNQLPHQHLPQRNCHYYKNNVVHFLDCHVDASRRLINRQSSRSGSPKIRNLTRLLRRFPCSSLNPNVFLKPNCTSFSRSQDKTFPS